MKTKLRTSVSESVSASEGPVSFLCGHYKRKRIAKSCIFPSIQSSDAMPLPNQHMLQLLSDMHSKPLTAEWTSVKHNRENSCMDRHLSISEKPNNSNDYALPERAVHEVRASPGKNRQSRRRRTEVDSLLDDGLMMQELNLAVSRWPKVLVSLSHKEKEDDFMIMKGTRLPQRPKRRSKEVEKLVMYVSPGAWLREVSLEKYEVREKRPAKRKPAGLKAMESMDSDSD